MPRRPLPAAWTGLAAVLALASLPVNAQTQQQAQQEPPAASAATQPAGEPAAPAASAPPAATQSSAEVPASTPAPVAPSAAEAPAPAASQTAQVDPLLVLVRERAAKEDRATAAADQAAIVAFYAQEQAKPMWITADGLTPKARQAMAEIAKADDWGLEAKAFDLPKLTPGETSPAALADAEVVLSRAVLKYARYARGGRLDPARLSRNFDMKPTLVDPKVVMDAAAVSDDPGAYLQGLHPKHRQFQLLRQALLKVRGGQARPEPAPEQQVEIPNGPLLKVGSKHAQVALLRERLKVAAQPGEEDVFDEELQAALKDFQRKQGVAADGVLGNATRTALNGGTPARAAFGSEEQRIIVNMERWRWMPEDLGSFHVWNNIPEFQTRVIKDGRTIHQARIVVGKPETQTTLFSAEMRYVVFGPEWGVPDSIKVKEILPYLRPTMDGGFFGWGQATDTRVLERHNLRVSYNGKPVDASQVDWTQVDIRRFTFIQPSGAGNVLGAIKFRFPNKHDIYMHDTPQRELFQRTVRAYSHGCIRVQDPGRFAEVLLDEDKGWPASRVKGMLAQGGNNEVTLGKHIPVHITYFTVMVGEDGRLQSFADLYGHDRRVAVALAGRPLPLEAPSVASSSSTRDAREARRKRYKQTNNDFFSGLFGN